MGTQHIRARIERASDPQRGTIPRTTADGLLRTCDEDDAASAELAETARTLLDVLRANWSALPTPWSQTTLSTEMCRLDDALGNPPGRNYPKGD